MIYGIKLTYSKMGGIVANGGAWIGTDGWSEPIPKGVSEYTFATEDVNKAYSWCAKLNQQRPGCTYQVEEMKL